ncbi:MAG: sulfopyruvate decarboxylase subunit beta [Acidobacteria bacterium]|nr:sulfopyruvate decarboxylase subunit beta [Acidobacteriota bacterium]
MSGKALMLRRDAIAVFLEELEPSRLVVLANGYVSRDGFNCGARDHHFYMLGSMGLAASIALGITLARPEAAVAVVDGDGNLLMGLGILPMVGGWQPRRFLHLVLDNGTYGATGGQATVSAAADFAAGALACGYARAERTDDADTLRRRTREWQDLDGPSLLHVLVSPEEPPPGRRVDVEPPEIARRFASALKGAP